MTLIVSVAVHTPAERNQTAPERDGFNRMHTSPRFAITSGFTFLRGDGTRPLLFNGARHLR